MYNEEETSQVEPEQKTIVDQSLRFFNTATNTATRLCGQLARIALVLREPTSKSQELYNSQWKLVQQRRSEISEYVASAVKSAFEDGEYLQKSRAAIPTSDSSESSSVPQLTSSIEDRFSRLRLLIAQCPAELSTEEEHDDAEYKLAYTKLGNYLLNLTSATAQFLTDLNQLVDEQKNGTAKVLSKTTLRPWPPEQDPMSVALC